MAALTKERDTTEIAQSARCVPLPVKSGVTIYQGSLVALENGYAIPGKKATGLICVGRAEATVTNNGADGDLSVLVSRGAFVWDNTATSGNKITTAHLFKPCYIEDDQTVTALATGASVAGLVVAVSDEGVTVEINSALTYPAGA